MAYLRKFHNQARVTMVPSLTMRRDLESAGFRNLEGVARGVDTQLFDPERRSQALRAAWGVHEQGLAVLCAGRIAPEKNLDLLIRTFQAIAQVRPDARLILVGDGPELAKLKAALNFVYCGARRGEDLARHYASADIFLFPSLTETFGNVLLEAMASGLACVSFDYAAAEHIRHGESGLKARYGDDGDFILQSLRLTEDASLRVSLGKEARATALNLPWQHIYNRLEAIFLGIVQAHEAYYKALFGGDCG